MALLSVKGLTVKFHTREGVVAAVDRASFDLDKGETLGVVGESGSGKSAMCSALLGLIPCPPGKIEGGQALFEGVDLLGASASALRKIRGARIAMVFQDPMTSLNPYIKIGPQLCEPLMLHKGMARKEATLRAIDALEETGVPDAARLVNSYPHQLSGGMRQRAMIAMALLAEPEILIADEPTTALDVTVQAQIIDMLKERQRKLGMAMLFVTHDLGVAAGACDRLMVMYAGKTFETGGVRDIFYSSQHPYTRALQRAMPSVSRKGSPLESIPGMPPRPGEIVEGCPFRPRCPDAASYCGDMDIRLQSCGAKGHESACLRYQRGELRTIKEETQMRDEGFYR